MLVRYILSSVCLRLIPFSQIFFMQYTGLCVFSLPISLLMIARIFVLHLIIIIKLEFKYKSLALFKVRPWNNGMHCMSCYIRSSQCSHICVALTCQFHYFIQSHNSLSGAFFCVFKNMWVNILLWWWKPKTRVTTQWPLEKVIGSFKDSESLIDWLIDWVKHRIRHRNPKWLWKNH